MNINRLICLLIGAICIIGLISCDQPSEDPGGVRVTPEMLESVSASLSEWNETEEQTTVTTTTSIAKTEFTTLNGVVFWTESGSVYHLSDQCGALRNAKNIFQGSIAEALAAKKEWVCKSCS